MRGVMIVDSPPHFRLPIRVLPKTQMEQKGGQLVLLLRGHSGHHPH